MRAETSDLLTVLNNLDGAMVEIILGMLEDTLSAEEQVRFGCMFVEVGTLLQQHAELTLLATAKGQTTDRDSGKQEPNTMDVPRGMVTDSVLTVDGTCRMSCEVLNEQIEFRFGDHIGGLHLFLDRAGYVKFVKLQAKVVERFFALPPGAPIKFLVGDDAGEELDKS